jgi:hypothetical protein
MIQIWTPWRQGQNFDAARFNDRSKGGGILRVAIVQKIATVSKEAASVHGRVPGDLLHPLLVRVEGDARDVDLAALKMNKE